MAAAFRWRPGPEEGCASGIRASWRQLTARASRVLPSPAEPRPRGKDGRKPGGYRTGGAAGTNGELRLRRRPLGPGCRSQRSCPQSGKLRQTSRERTTLTFHIRHVPLQNARAAWATAKRAITDSRRPQASPLEPAHLCASRCVPRRRAGPCRGLRSVRAVCAISLAGFSPLTARLRMRVRFGSRNPAFGGSGWEGMRSLPRQR